MKIHRPDIAKLEFVLTADSAEDRDCLQKLEQALKERKFIYKRFTRTAAFSAPQAFEFGLGDLLRPKAGAEPCKWTVYECIYALPSDRTLSKSIYTNRVPDHPLRWSDSPEPGKPLVLTHAVLLAEPTLEQVAEAYAGDGPGDCERPAKATASQVKK